MAKVTVLLADGFEEVEAVSIADVLRRADIEVALTGLREGPVEGAHGIKIIPDISIDDIKPDDFDMVVLPGGQPGSDNLNGDQRVKVLIKEFSDKGKLTGAICAAPYVLANAGVLDGKHATSYPAFRDRLGAARYEEKAVVSDGNIITSQGPGTALCFALEIVGRLAGTDKAEQIKEGMLVAQICD